MQRYNEQTLTFQTSNRTIQQRKIPPISKRRPKRKQPTGKAQRGSHNKLNTIDVSNPTDLRIQFEPEESWVDKGTPGVGEYDISSPFVKPSYETYEKSDQVILVKINHIGGTSSFRSEGQRFLDNNSIYQPTTSPGPGTYQVAIGSQRNKKHLSASTYHENYDLIQELMRNSRERTESMPNYKIGVPQPGLEYNGLPRHLQEMYINLNREKETTSTVKSLPLDKLIKIRKRNEKLPILQSRNGQAFASCEKKRYAADKMTETMYRLDEQIKKQAKRQQKIMAILKPSTESKTKPTEHETIDPFRGRTRRQMAFNKNMVNILFQRAGK